MIEIISKWILNRLGWVVDMTPANFRAKTTNGRLIAQLLLSYDIITTEEFNLLKKSNHVSDCYDNFNLIDGWLRSLHLDLPEEDVYEIVNGVGSASLDLFYRVFLELKDKTKLDFLTDNELNAQLGKRSHRFDVTVIEDDLEKVKLKQKELCQPFLDGGDVYRWHKDRFDAMQMHCKEARDEYLHNTKIKAKSSTTIITVELFHKASGVNNEDVEALVDTFDADKTYEELIELQEEAKSMQKFVPDAKKAEKILKNFRAKRKVREEKRQLGTQWHQAIMSQFDKKINDSKAKCDDRLIVDIFMRQSLYEKELVSKLGQVKLEIEHIKENRYKQFELLNKLKADDFIDASILKEKEINEQKLMYFLERERLLELHQKIINEKARLSESRNTQICKEALQAMADISIEISDYKQRYGQEPNRREMENFKNLFVSGQSIFELFEPVIDIVKDNDYDISEEISEEITRQDAIDQREFEKYLNYEWPWEAKNSSMIQIRSGLDVLGYIVHRALETKYPRVPLWEKAILPQISTRVCLNGLNDASLLPNLRKLLNEKHIEVIQLNETVDYCLEVYRQESEQKEDEEDEDLVSLTSREQKANKEVAKFKKGEKLSSIKPDVEEDTVSDPMETQTKKVQTPQKFPCELIPYSHSAQLGKTAQDLLDQGKPIGDILLIDMFIEYLKSIPNLKGWVLINYPTYLEQALLLEEALTGVNPDPECNLYTDTKRHSKFLSNPIKPKPIQVYDTALTAFIRLKKISDDTNCDAILPPIYEQLPDNVDPLDKYYSDAGANYSMYYKELDFGTTKYLGKLIIGDYSLPLKTSSELFGNFGYLNEHTTKSVKATKVGRRLKKPKMQEISNTKVIVDVKDKKGKSHIVIVFADKSVQVPTIEDEEDECDEEDSELLSEIEEPAYCQSTCPDELLIHLATVWETVEEIYMNDLEQVFFLIRLNLDSVMPFVQYVKDCMRKIIERPDQKSVFLSEFQIAFNSFDIDFRADDEFKVELFCRIEEFKEKLSEMTEEKMTESENMRCRVIEADWAPRQLNELVKYYLIVLQIEVERFIESVHFINDYYKGILTGLPTDDEMYKEDTVPKFKEIGADYINKMFLDSSSGIEMTEFEELLSHVAQKMQNIVKKVSGCVSDCIEKSKVGPSAGSTKPAKSKAGSEKSKMTRDTKKPIEPIILKEDANKIKEEWQRAANGESLRVNLQIEVIKNRALESIREFLTLIQKPYHEVFNAICTKYSNEMENIDKVCDIFKAAVENEIALQKELTFDGHSLRINTEINLYDNPPIIPRFHGEIVPEGAFTIAQLSKLSEIFLDLSPSGYISKANFIFVLQNAISNEDSLMPKLWTQLAEMTKLKKVADALFDDLEYIYWKDFIVYNIRIPFPSEMDIYMTQKAFRECDPDTTGLIQDYQLYSTNLWFENRIDIKKLLFKLYRVENCGFNYTAMLLDFCKDKNAVEGFAKALQLFLGKIVCWDFNLGDVFKEKYLDSPMHQQDNKNDDIRSYMLQHEITKLVKEIVDVVANTKVQSRTSLDSKSIRGSCLKKNRGQGEELPRELRLSKSVEFADSCTEKIVPKIEESSSSSSEEAELINLYNNNELPLDNNAGAKDSFESAEIIFLLPLEVILTVINASIPWHVRLQNIGDSNFCERAMEIYEKFRNPDFEMSVLSHEYLESEMFRDLLKLTKKFCALDPVKIVEDVLEENI